MDETSARLFLLVLLVVLLAVATVAALVIARLRGSEREDPERKYQPLWQRLTRALGPGIAPKDETRTYEGIQYRYSVQPGGKNAPPSLTLAVDCASYGDFQVRRENGFDRFFKRIGITSEVQTGDPSFDAEYFIDTNTPELARAFFSDHRQLARVRRISELGFTAIKHDGKALGAAMRLLGKEPDEPVVHSAVVELSELASGMLASPSFGLLTTPPWKAKRLALAAASVLLYGAGIASLVFGLIEYPPLDKGLIFLDSLRYGIPALLAYSFACILLLRGRSKSHVEIVVALAVALVAIPLSTWGFETFVNGHLDHSVPQSHQVRVRDKYTSTSKNGTTHHVLLDSWRKPGGVEHVTVTSSRYREIRVRETRATVTTRAGHLGFEWVVRYDWS